MKQWAARTGVESFVGSYIIHKSYFIKHGMEVGLVQRNPHLISRQSF